MLSLRARIFIIISLVILFILGISLFLIINGRKPANNEQNATSTQGNIIQQNNFNQTNLQQIPTQVPAGVPIKAQTSLETEQNAVKQFAKIFTERYGSYSTDNNFQNITDVESLATQSLWKKISANMGATQTAQIFHGVTTKVITAEITNWSDSSAVVEVKSVRTEQKAGTETKSYQNAQVTLVKTGGKWLVDKFAWE